MEAFGWRTARAALLSAAFLFCVCRTEAQSSTGLFWARQNLEEPPNLNMVSFSSGYGRFGSGEGFRGLKTRDQRNQSLATFQPDFIQQPGTGYLYGFLDIEIESEDGSLSTVTVPLSGRVRVREYVLINDNFGADSFRAHITWKANGPNKEKVAFRYSEWYTDRSAGDRGSVAARLPDHRGRSEVSVTHELIYQTGAGTFVETADFVQEAPGRFHGSATYYSVSGGTSEPASYTYRMTPMRGGKYGRFRLTAEAGVRRLTATGPAEVPLSTLRTILDPDDLSFYETMTRSLVYRSPAAIMIERNTESLFW